jgi:hypothetical protein
MAVLANGWKGVSVLMNIKKLISKTKIAQISVICSLLTILSLHLSAQLAEGKCKFLGNIIASSVPTNFNDYWNQVTPENAGKWGSVCRVTALKLQLLPRYGVILISLLQLVYRYM